MKEYKIKNVSPGLSFLLGIGGFMASIFVIVMSVVIASAFANGFWWSALIIMIVFPLFFYFILPYLTVSKDTIIGLSDDYLSIKGEKYFWRDIHWLSYGRSFSTQGVTFITSDGRKIVLMISNQTKDLVEWKKILRGIVRGFNVNNLHPKSIYDKGRMKIYRQILLLVNIALIPSIYILIEQYNISFGKLIGPLLIWCGVSFPLIFQTFAARNHDPLRKIPLD